MPAEFIQVEVSDYVATVVMNRPPVNAQNAQFRNEIMEVFDAFNDRDDVRVAILTGAGNVFSAGADIKERRGLVRQPGDYARHNRVAREYTNCIRECAVPVIAAVNGAALGAGFGLMAACDIMLASDNAVFGMPEIDVGLAGGAAMLTHLVGKSRTRRILFTGERITAQELYRLGVIECCLPRAALMEEALKLARTIADGLNAVLPPSYAADKDGGEHVKLRKKAKDAANFSVEITFNAPGFSVILDD